jgi:hypothetical protein
MRLRKADVKRVLLTAAGALLAVVTGCGSGSNTAGTPTTISVSLPTAGPNGHTTFAQIRYIIAQGGDLKVMKGSECHRPYGLRANKVVTVKGPSFCSVATKFRGTPLFGNEREAVEPLFPIFKELFRIGTDEKGGRVASVFISVSGQVTTVGGKTKLDTILNAECDRAANSQIDWDNIDVDGLEQLCTVRKFVNFG